MHFLFSGDADSPLYQQLLAVYHIYRFVVEQRNGADSHADFVMYADELFCYGLYKLDGDDYSAHYRSVYDALFQASGDEKTIYTAKGLTYSHNGYFKSAKSRYDLDRLLGFVPGKLS